MEPDRLTQNAAQEVQVWIMLVARSTLDIAVPGELIVTNRLELFHISECQEVLLVNTKCDNFCIKNYNFGHFLANTQLHLCNVLNYTLCLFCVFKFNTTNCNLNFRHLNILFISLMS